MGTVLDSPEPASIMDALDQIRQRDSELSRIRQRLAQAQQELEDTNRGLIALYSELEEARQAEARLAAVVQASDDAIISMTPTGVIQTWNPGATRLLGRPEGQVIGRPLNIVMSAQARALFVQSLDQLQFGATAAPFDTQWSRSDGSEVHVTVSVFALRDDTGALTGISAVARDITAKIEAKNQLERLAHFDTLTGLVNRAETLVRLESALADTRIPGKHVGVLFCDIDHFKSINDTWGHTVGDVVLTTVAGRIGDCLRHDDTVGRMGGDEMLILLRGVHSLDEAADIAEKVRCHVGTPIRHGDHVIRATLSIGVTLAVRGESVSAMTARADDAMYAAKRAGRDTVTRIAAPG